MENCNLIFGILIISAMLYIIILNNPIKEHATVNVNISKCGKYGCKGGSNKPYNSTDATLDILSLGVGVAAWGTKKALCTKESDAARSIRENHEKTNPMTSKLGHNSPCTGDYNCASKKCSNGKCATNQNC